MDLACSLVALSRDQIRSILFQSGLGVYPKTKINAEKFDFERISSPPWLVNFLPD